MTPHVSDAIAQLGRAFSDHQVVQLDDGQGGAFVIVEGLDLGPAFAPSASWIGFAISSMYPRADVYPHFARPDLARSDHAALTTPLNPGHTMPGFNRPAVMISRRSSRWDPARDTAALKLHRILLWFNQQAAPLRIAA